jgi:hypothetical protein
MEESLKTRSKAVNFAAYNETQDVRGTIKSSKSMGGGKSGTFRHAISGKGVCCLYLYVRYIRV